MSGAPAGPHGPHGPPGPPYPPTTASLGLTPTTSLDVPITSVFLGLFLVGAACNMAIIIANRKRGHKFLITNMLFGFCMARTLTCVMRIVWAYRLTNISVAIAAQIFVQAGVLILFMVNLIFTQRIIRAAHPRIGWHKSIEIGFNVFYGTVFLLLFALIFCVVQSFYTLKTHIIKIDLDIEHLGQAYFLTAAVLPIPVILIGSLLPKPPAKDGEGKIDKFGSGSFSTKVLLVLCTSVILSLGSAFRFSTSLLPRPREDPAWYNSKACFYVFNFSLEITVVALYIIMRVDRRFHVPDGAKGPGDYSAGRTNNTSDADEWKDDTVVSTEVVWVETADEWAERARVEMDSTFKKLERQSNRWSFYN